jgi:hypothetical protein
MNIRHIFRLALAATALLAGLAHNAEAHILTFTGDITGGATFDRAQQYGWDIDFGGHGSTYRAYDINVSEYTDLLVAMTTCAFDCSTFLYQDSFNPDAALDNLVHGSDGTGGLTAQATVLGLRYLPVGHYFLVISGDHAGEMGAFSTTFVSTSAVTVSEVSAVPEPSSALMLLAGLAGLAGLRLARRRSGVALPRLLPRALMAALLMAGAAQQAQADILTFVDDTTWAPTFARPARNGGDFTAVVAYKAYNIKVDSWDPQGDTFLTACDFNCSMFLYVDHFDPADGHANLFQTYGEGTDGGVGVAFFANMLTPGRTYVLVIGGEADYDWGKFSTTVGGAGHISISAVPEPSVYAMLLAGLAGVGGLARRKRLQGERMA